MNFLVVKLINNTKYTSDIKFRFKMIFINNVISLTEGRETGMLNRGKIPDP